MCLVLREGYNAWRDCEKPSEILTWKCLSHNLSLPEYTSDYVSLAGYKFELDNEYEIEDTAGKTMYCCRDGLYYTNAFNFLNM